MTSWFFEDYLPRWVAVASGASDEGPEFIHEYWDTPMRVTGLGQSFWCLEDADVRAFLDLNLAPSGRPATRTPSSRTSACRRLPAVAPNDPAVPAHAPAALGDLNAGSLHSR